MILAPLFGSPPVLKLMLAPAPPTAWMTRATKSQLTKTVEKTFGENVAYWGPRRLMMTPRMKKRPAARNEGARMVQQILATEKGQGE